MSHLPSILLRCCQSMIVALALCLPEVDPGFAQSLQEIGADLNPQLGQELILAEGESVPEVPVGVTPTEDALESIPTPIESEASGEDAEQTTPSTSVAAREKAATAEAPAQVLPPAESNRDDILTQPAINSQLLLPARSEKVQLLLAPARESAQLFLPAATEVKWLLPAASEVSVDRTSPTIQSQLLLPSETNANLPPEFSPSTTLAVTVRDTTKATSVNTSLNSAANSTVNSTVRSTMGENRPSTAEQIGRSIARSTVRSFPRPASETIPSRIPQAETRLLPASTTPRTPIAASPDRSFFPLLQEKSGLNPTAVNLALVSQTLPKTQSSPTARNQVTDKPTNPSPEESNTPTLESPVASGQIGVTSAPVDDRVSIFSEPNWLFAGLGALLLLLIGVVRWIGNGFQSATDESEIDWANLPRSPKNLPSLILPEPTSAYVSKFQLPKLTSPNLIIHPVGTESPSTIAVDNLPPSNSPKRLASSLLFDGKNDRPARAMDPAAQTNLAPTQNNPETWIWITVLGIGLLGIGAWVVQFYGLGI